VRDSRLIVSGHLQQMGANGIEAMMSA